MNAQALELQKNNQKETMKQTNRSTKRRKKYNRGSLSPTFEQGNTLLSKWWSTKRNYKKEASNKKINE
jgi:hypothetical protein